MSVNSSFFLNKAHIVKTFKRIIICRFRLILFLALPLILVAAWFKNGNMLATGEEGMIFYDASRMLRLYATYWVEVGTGYLTPLYIPRLSFYFFISILQSIGFEGWVVQAIVLYLALTGGMCGAYLFYRELLGKKPDLSVVLTAALFYSFNLYVVRQIWVRFLITGIMAWAFLPLFLYFVLKFIRSGEKLTLLLFLFTNLLFSYIFSAPVYILTFWIPGILIIFYAIFESKSRKNRLERVARSITIVLSWVVVSVWWLYPVLSLAGAAFGTLISGTTNIDSLRGVSDYFQIDQILLLKQKFLFSGTGIWAYYHNLRYVFIGIAILFFVIYGLIVGRRYHFYKWGVFIFGFSLFIVKGTNPPFGDMFYEILFKFGPILGVLRNPYEKFGIVFVLFYSVFFAIGFEVFLRRFRGAFSNLVRYVLYFLIFGYFLWPLWTGVFFRNIEVEVPEHYRVVNELIVRDKMSDARVLHLPLNPGDGIEYAWSTGYSGNDQMHLLFDNPSIARVIHTSKYYDAKHEELGKEIWGQSIHSKLNEMNIGYIVFHNDFSKSQGWVSEDKSKESFLKDDAVVPIAIHDGLELYRYKAYSDSLFTILGESGLTFEYEKLSSRHYLVSFKNVQKPFTLVFKATYHPLWQARIGNSLVKEHFVAYNYANGWRIERKGSYDINVFLPIWPWEK